LLLAPAVNIKAGAYLPVSNLAWGDDKRVIVAGAVYRRRLSLAPVCLPPLTAQRIDIPPFLRPLRRSCNCGHFDSFESVVESVL